MNRDQRPGDLRRQENLGVCKLCRESGELQDSHYLPKNVFRTVARSFEPYDTAPVVVNGASRSALRTNEQPTKHLLCRNCEDRFSKFGECPVAKYCYHNERSFRLREVLEGLKPSEQWGGDSFYLGADVSSALNVEAFMYFALSVFWRGSVVRWPPPYHRFYEALGPRYTEEFRKYLSGESPCPSKVVLNVYVDYDLPCGMGLSAPEPDRCNEGGLRSRLHSFMIPGIRFALFVGGNVADHASAARRGSQVGFLQWSFRNSPSYRSAERLVLSSQPKGKLAREMS